MGSLSKRDRSLLQGRVSKLVHEQDPGIIVGNQPPAAVGATEHTYKRNGFDPSREVNELSYTAGRVLKNVFNKYQKNTYDVFCYYTDWSQYDGRYEKIDAPNSECGRGIDLLKLKDGPYDKIVIGFAAIVGDKGEKRATIEQAAKDFDRSPDQVTFTDAWGDVASYVNCGFDGWVSNDYLALYSEEKAQGVLGGLRKLKQANPNLRISFSLGGWTMSEAFHWVAAEASRRAVFAQSITAIFQKFPMFSELDLDWEYPAAEGNTGNTFDDTDPANFAALVKAVKAELQKIGRNDVIISIAAAASLKKLEKANIPLLVDAGVYGINLMTYDFFGTPWATELAHHSNLYSTEGSPDSVDKAVQYLKGLGIPSKQIFIGYANYSRNGQNASITSESPLKGTYSPNPGKTTTGSFESGVTEWYDALYNYLDLENQRGLNGFNVYTDQVAKADYLYNPGSKLFLSLDTPRTVREKARYVVEQGLGGIFTWTGDMDSGVLVNAAREGLGCELLGEPVVDMAPFYFEGINVTPPGNGKPVAHISGKLEVAPGEKISLSGEGSTDPDGDSLSYLWSAPGLSFDGATTVDVSGLAPEVDDASYPVKLTVSDGQDQGSASVTVEVLAESDVPVWDPNENHYDNPDRVRYNKDEKYPGVWKTYEAQWWVGPNDPPGLNSTTTDEGGYGLPWWRLAD